MLFLTHKSHTSQVIVFFVTDFSIHSAGGIISVYRFLFKTYCEIRVFYKFLFFLAKPGMFDLKGKAKWEAWNSRKGTSKDDAKKKYVEKVASLISSIGLK